MYSQYLHSAFVTDDDTDFYLVVNFNKKNHCFSSFHILIQAVIHSNHMQ